MIDISKLNRENAGKLFDYSILPKYTQEKDIREGCKTAIKYNCAAFYSSSPYWSPVVVEELKGTDIRPAVGIAFPFGSAPASVKAFETADAVKKGCTAVDIVMNIGALKDKRYDVVKEELIEFKKAAAGALTKVILEVCYLTDDEIAAGSRLVAEAGLDYAKTSSGQFDGPSMEQFLVMKEALKGTDVRLKVSGVKFPRAQNAFAFILAGAELIGTRAAPEIIDGMDMLRKIGMIPPYER